MNAFRLSVAVVVAFGVTGLAGPNDPAARADGNVEARDVVEALFMGSGRLTPSDGLRACPYTGFWSGFPRGTTVTVRVSTTVSEGVIQAVRRALEQVPALTGGAIDTVFERTDDPAPIPSPNEVTLTFHPDPVRRGCPFERGCIMHRFVERGVFLSGRAVQPSGMPINAYVHDVVGHGIMGMCHIDGNRIGGARNSLMSGGPGVYSGDIGIRLTALDAAAAKAVYASPLSPGASRDDFVRYGLIDDR